MRLRLFLLLVLAAALPALAQKATLSGLVVDAYSGAPISGATVRVGGQSDFVTTSPAGDFQLPVTAMGERIVTVEANGYNPVSLQVQIAPGNSINLGTIMVEQDDFNADFYNGYDDMMYDENVFDDEGSSQSINALTGASDDIYYRNASYNFGPMYFNYRGYNSTYNDVYINGLRMNDLMRGNFSYSTLMGMTSRAFRNKTTTVGLNSSAYGFGGIGGSANFNTVTSGYAPGYNASVAYTNSAYMLRGMFTYSTGINDKGWGATVSIIGRYAPEGVIDGTFYNSGALFVSLEKEFSPKHALVLTAFGGPTQRATASATYQEAYDLAGSNLYNRNWGYQDGKKRSSSIRNSFDPTVILNWIWKPTKQTSLNTAAGIRWVNYSSSAFNYYNANNPNPDYYKYLPSYWSSNQEMYDLMTRLWQTDVNTRQIDWNELYQANYFNNALNEGKAEADKVGSSYILEDRHSNQFNMLFSSFLNHRLNSTMTLQAGINFNYTNASYYKTVRDLLGGEFWLDIDPYSDQIATIDPDVLQNDLDNPNRHVTKGDRFGYDYNIYGLQLTGWLQNIINLPQWDINYGLSMSYTQYQRDGHMRNGRAPDSSLGKSSIARFDDAMAKVGVTYKVNGRNFFQLHATYGTKAPIADNIFVAPRIKNDLAAQLESEKIFSGDISYMWNYRSFRGSVTGYFTNVTDATEHYVFYDDNHSTNANFTLEGVKRQYKGVEVGLAYKITPSITATFAGTFSRSQYKNNPKGVRSFENGMYADTTQTVYLKNYYLGSTPQQVYNLGIDWAAPHNWFFNINGTWEGSSYVNVGIPQHEEIPGLWEVYPDMAELEAQAAAIRHQDKLKDAFCLNISIGKLLYLTRKTSMNINVNVSNVLNNKNVCTYAYQQNRLYTKTYDPTYYANRYSYAQGIRVFVNVGIRF